MSDEDALLAAIEAHPDEDTPRLVYADWLDEHDRPVRAEFIRVQCAAARLEGQSQAEQARGAAVFARSGELAERHRAELLGPLAALDGYGDVWFRRGFVSQVRARVGPFLVHADRLARARPRPGVRVTHAAEMVAHFLRCPRLDLVTELSVYAPDRPSQEFPGEGDVTAGVNRLTRLAALDLDGCHVGDWFCTLLGNFALPALEALSLNRNAVTDVGVLDLLHSEHPKKLRRLLLSANPIADAGAIELAERWPRGADDRLEHLGLRGAQIGPDGADALVARFGNRVEL